MTHCVRLLALTFPLALAAFGQDPAGVRAPAAEPTPVSPAIAGAPFSADEVAERAQTLADGTHTSQPSSVSRIYRDSAGRTRTERSVPMHAPPGQPDAPKVRTLVVIVDPLAHVRYTLTGMDKVAHKRTIPASGNRQMLPPTSVATRVGDEGSIMTVAPLTTTVEKLGSQTIEGLLAEGSRHTTTWPIGSRGNRRPIVVVTETWMSPELGVPVLTRESNPITGDLTRKLTNIVRAEPPAELFQPPADYTVTEDNPASLHANGAGGQPSSGSKLFELRVEPPKQPEPPVAQPPKPVN